jgi:hypothetical protein
MELSTTTALLSEACDDPWLIEGTEVVERLHGHGYRVLDFNFGFYTHTDYILRGEDWQKKVDRVADTAAKLGVTFSQSHIPFYHIHPSLDANLQKSGGVEYFDECTRRAYIASGMLGVKYATVHPLTDIFHNCTVSDSFQLTRTYYEPYIELGMKYNVGTAYENLFAPFQREIVARYGQNYEQLIELVDSYRDDRVGICWDFGHANEMKLNQEQALRAVGHRLKNLHINDNNGTRDEHLLPFMGTVKWKELIPVLAEIGYQGDLTFETGAVTRKAARAIQDAYITATYACGEYLLSLYREAKAGQARGEVQKG